MMAVLPTGFGKSLIFQLLVLMFDLKSKRHGGAGYASIIVILPLQSIIHDQVLEVNSMGMSASNLKNLEEIHLGKFNIVYESAEAVMDKEFLNSLKSQQSLFNANLVTCIVDETHTVKTWTGLR